MGNINSIMKKESLFLVFVVISLSVVSAGITITGDAISENSNVELVVFY